MTKKLQCLLISWIKMGTMKHPHYASNTCEVFLNVYLCHDNKESGKYVTQLLAFTFKNG